MMRDVAELLESLKRTPVILSEFVKTIPADRLDLRRKQGFWTIAEHVVHLARVQPMLLARLQRFMEEDHPEFTPYFPGKDAEPESPVPDNAVEALDHFARFRERQLNLLAGADDRTWRKTGTHPEYEAYSLHILIRHILMHDYWHMYRMEELWLTRDSFLTELK